MSDVRDALSTVLIDTSNDEEGIRQLGVTINQGELRAQPMLGIGDQGKSAGANLSSGLGSPLNGIGVPWTTIPGSGRVTALEVLGISRR